MEIRASAITPIVFWASFAVGQRYSDADPIWPYRYRVCLFLPKVRISM